MSNKDLHNIVRAVVAIAPVAAGTTGTGQVGDVVDRKGYNGVEFVIGYGAITATNATFTVLISEGDVTGTMTSVADASLLGTEVLASQLGATTRVPGESEIVTKRIGYTGNKRYVQCGIVNTVTAATPVSATAVLHTPEAAPTDNP